MNGLNLSSRSTVTRLCNEFGFNTSKRFGQNFIVSDGLCPKIVEHSGATNKHGVIEIGPGIGTLTKQLSITAKKVVAIEVDTRLGPLLNKTLSGCSNIEVIFKDILKLDVRKLIDEKFADMPVMIIANLPYNITSPIIMKLLEDRLPVESITVMVQKEAADRICAHPGQRECGAISIAVSYFAVAQRLFLVSPGSFMPPPKVSSAVIKLLIRPVPSVVPRDEKHFFSVIKAGFAQRRKTVVNAISAGLCIDKQQAADAVATATQNVNIRAEQLSIEEWKMLSDRLYKSYLLSYNEQRKV